MKLQDRVAVVTGGSRGLGREIVPTFAAEGAKVVVAFEENLALQRSGRPDEVIGAALFFATDASYATGSVPELDGGRL